MALPRNNLPTAAVPWGRRLEAAVLSNDRRLSNLSEGQRGENGAQASQLSTIGKIIMDIGEQASEIAARSTQFVEMQSVTNTLNVPGGTLINPGPTVSAETVYEIDVPQPLDGVDRTPFIFISGSAFVDTPDIGFSSGVRVSCLGRTTALAAPMQASAPEGWNQVFNFQAIGARGLGSFELRVYSEAGYNYSSAVTIATGVTDLRLVVSYGAS